MRGNAHDDLDFDWHVIAMLKKLKQNLIQKHSGKRYNEIIL